VQKNYIYLSLSLFTCSNNNNQLWVKPTRSSLGLPEKACVCNLNYYINHKYCSPHHEFIIADIRDSRKLRSPVKTKIIAVHALTGINLCKLKCDPVHSQNSPILIRIRKSNDREHFVLCRLHNSLGRRESVTAQPSTWTWAYIWDVYLSGRSLRVHASSELADCLLLLSICAQSNFGKWYAG
jgi:hypothetical protein